MNVAVSTMLTSAAGMSHFQASVWSWSSRNRGNVQRIQMKMNDSSRTFVSNTTGPRKLSASSLTNGSQ